jgi:hypothetical protein
MPLRNVPTIPPSTASLFCFLDPPRPDRHPASEIPSTVSARRYAGNVKHSVLHTTPIAEKPALREEEPAERLRLLAERLRSVDGPSTRGTKR